MYGLIAPCYRQSSRLFAPPTKKMHQQLSRPRKGVCVAHLEWRSSRRSLASNNNNASPQSTASSPFTSPSSSAGGATSPSTTVTTTESGKATSKTITNLFSSIASYASSSASQMTNRAKDKTFRLAADTAEHISSKAKGAVAKVVSSDIRTSVSNTKESMRSSIVDASSSLKDRLKETIAKRLPESSSSSTTTTTTTTPSTSSIFSSSKHQILSNARQSISNHANAASNRLLKSANTLSQSTIESASQRAIQASNQLQDAANKTIRWLWWWGLAAVGVYGVSTTLTKEGVQILKDFFTSSSSSSSSKEKLMSSSSSSLMAGQRGSKSENYDDDALVDYEECIRGFGDGS